jgi:hypothetical protein
VRYRRCGVGGLEQCPFAIGQILLDEPQLANDSGVGPDGAVREVAEIGERLARQAIKSVVADHQR